MSDLQPVRYPSMTVGWDKEGKMHCLALGDAQECIGKFKEERDQKNFERVAYFRKMKPDKARETGKKPKKMVSVDYSRYDGDKGRALKAKEQAELAAAEVISDTKQSTPKAKAKKNS